MNNGIETKLKDMKTLLKKLEARSQEILTLIEKATLEDTLIIKKHASMHQQTTYGIFETLEDTADKHADKLIE